MKQTPKAGRIVLAHYLNPAAYPPVLHAAEVLATAGWQVQLVGTRDGASAAIQTGLEDVPGVQITLFDAPRSRRARRATYVAFVARALAFAARADWLYASDMLATPVGWMARALLRRRVVYHEHDAPPETPTDAVARFCAPFRQRLGRRADLVVVPQAERLAAFVASTGRTGPSLVVWNTPLRREVRALPRPPHAGLTLYYHGSLNAHRLPFALLDALVLLPDAVRLLVVGYETVGATGYVDAYLGHAARVGVAERVTFRPPTSREGLWSSTDEGDVGLVFMPMQDAPDPNLVSMVGASNKAFDYLARGLALLVSDLPEWRDTYVTPGYGVACDPRDPASIAAALRPLVDAPAQFQKMGEAGRQRSLVDWNYERHLAPVLAALVA